MGKQRLFEPLQPSEVGLEAITLHAQRQVKTFDRMLLPMLSTATLGLITPVVLHDDDGYWLASYNLETRQLAVVRFHYWPCKSNRKTNAAQQVVNFLQVAGLKCQGYLEGYVGVEVCDRWNSDASLQDPDGNPIEGAETIALEQLISEQDDFLEKHCEFINWPPSNL